MTDQETREARFIEYLEGLARRNDRAALAALRRGLGRPPGTTFEMFPLVEPWVTGFSHRDRTRYYLVASVFADHPEHKPGSTLGHTFLEVSRRDRRPGESPDDAKRRAERRFVALLNAHPEDVWRHLRHAVSLAASREVPIDYVALLRDLGHWDSPSRWVQQKWARAFWGSEESQVASASEKAAS